MPQTKVFKVSRISEGLAFGQGPISGQDEANILQELDFAIENDDQVLVPVSLDDDGHSLTDDGCGDGRPAIKVYKLNKTFKKNLSRPKVFGGALVMAMAANIGNGLAAARPLQQLFSETIDELESKHINFGAHTDEHASGDNCGCGAIDRAPEVILAVLKYQRPIREVIKALGISDEGFDEVLKNYGTYVREVLARATPYSGKQVMAEITAASKVIKQLSGNHLERRIILNEVRGYTVNQRLLREVTNDQAQVFAIEVWRLVDIANQQFEGKALKIHQAVLSQLAYTLGIAAVLTQGDLPVYRIGTTG
ncbi:MAG TPA: cadmium-containing carbonic anhydrase [Candidatus Saccharimonadales bacterium]|nr:cadmium-containing carbonic anhydrase [Candidatus Saccharimonadales bacterium]